VSTFDLLRSVTDKVRTSHLPFVFRVPFFPSEAFFDASEVDRVFSSCHPYSARAYLIVQFSARRFEQGKPRTTTLWTVHPPWNFFPSIFGNIERSFGLFSTLKSKKSSTHNKDMCWGRSGIARPQVIVALSTPAAILSLSPTEAVTVQIKSAARSRYQWSWSKRSIILVALSKVLPILSIFAGWEDFKRSRGSIKAVSQKRDQCAWPLMSEKVTHLTQADCGCGWV
jgi:hypothetical protein